MKSMYSTFLFCFCLVILFFQCKPKSETELVAELAYNVLPDNVYPSCTLSQTTFNSWFQSGTASENGAVTPANSVDFVHNNNCDFYQWSARMFLWITSPQASGYNLNSPLFYTVSPPDSLKQRVLIPNSPGTPLRAAANISKDGLVDSEEGQATDDVLMAQNGSLLYYITFVNDMYAVWMSGVKAGALPGNSFPSTSKDRDAILAYAKSIGVTLSEPNTLAMELKTSWVEASYLPNPQDYIVIDAIVPVYDTTSATVWKPVNEKTTKLAMVGIHVVGSTSGHPEMVWATFEHKNNSPNSAYVYNDTQNNPVTVPADTGNGWLLNGDVSNSNTNNSHMTFDKKNGNIVANTNYTISASNTLRTKPWGSAVDTIPNQNVVSVAQSNSEVLSLNVSVQNNLVGNDIRKNYLFLGATWTPNGLGPNGISYTPVYQDSLNTVGVAIGTSQLANSTMETYAQNGLEYNQFGSCFGCHSAGGKIDPGSISHIFDALQPLGQGLRQKQSVLEKK
jgi:hypothetical protein